jgi:hypothetical protein
MPPTMTTVDTPHSHARAARIKAALFHLIGSALVVGLLAAWVVVVWYPFPYWKSSGGINLLALIAGVDVVLGPLVTLVIFNIRKPLKELRTDILLVVLLQLSAMGYGLWSAYQARPLFNVFEYRLFRVVHTADIPEALPGGASGVGVIRKPGVFDGPVLLSLRDFHDNREQIEATAMALEGLSLSARPDFWQPYGQAQAAVLAAAKPLRELLDTGQVDAMMAGAWVQEAGKPADAFGYVPLIDRVGEWVVVVDMQTSQPMAYWELHETQQRPQRP